jgi:hypothetical protein
VDVEESNQASTIRAIAVELLVLINGIARLRLDNPDPVSLGNVRRYGEGGAKDVFVFPAAAIARARMGTPTIAVNGVVMAPPSWLPDIEQADDAVEAVLTFLSRPGTAYTPHSTRS